ncbi:hypothetical protein DVR12_02665 [Chitinophaga silvatica]|uniref:Carboxypeptidase regulatory-like domain-containing protein n=1 Tax=Chitinophaga silvatica TaxID=2282649 RepID=A0A3E1YH72_9BACT|nr:hypothetical protein [Chitinophaga silvatica]RFS26708.1 hypothetical protein DVR12_02665 [Chitinophaga silvatica]
MQKPLKSIFLLLLPFACFAQKTVLPGNPDINAKRLKPGKSLFTIYYVKDQTWTKKGSYTNELTILGNEMYFITNYIDEKEKWYKKRTSVADAKTLSPVSYKSEGLKNVLDLKFGNPVTGKEHFLNGEKDKQLEIKPTGKYVDFNIAELLFTTLPLDVGYKATVPEFYYGSSPDSVLSNYLIKDVKSYLHYSPKTGKHESWLVSVLEEESGVIYTYIIDKKDHRIWQREMPAGGGTIEICTNEELDYLPIESKFDKEENLNKLEKGNSAIVGTAFARDHNKGSLAVVNINRAQYAPIGTVVSILPNSPYIQEWKEVNRKIRKGKKLPEVPIDPNVAACIKTTKVYDDKGHFEFTNLMPGEYILFTTFGYTHRYSYQYRSGTSYLMHPSGAVLSSSPTYGSASASSGATAEIESIVTIRKDGDKVDVSLKEVR